MCKWRFKENPKRLLHKCPALRCMCADHRASCFTLEEKPLALNSSQYFPGIRSKNSVSAALKRLALCRCGRKPSMKRRRHKLLWSHAHHTRWFYCRTWDYSALWWSLVRARRGSRVICTSTATDQIHTFKANSDHSDTVPSTRRRHWVSDFSRSWLENLHRRCSGTLTSCKIHVFKWAFLNFFDCLSVLLFSSASQGPGHVSADRTL